MATPLDNRPAPLAPRTFPFWREAILPQWIFLAVAPVVVTAAIVAIAVVQAGAPIAVLAAIVQAGAATTVVAALAAAWLLRRMYQPILGLSQAAGRLQQGDTATPIPAVTQRALLPVAHELERARAGLRTDLVRLAEEEARQRALINALTEPLLTTDVQGRVTSWNLAAAGLFGDPQELRGRPIRELLPFVNPQEVGPWQGQLSKGGQPADFWVTRAALPGGQLAAAHVHVLHDISQQVELNRLRERLLFSVAHELMGPTTVLGNALDMLSEAGGERDVRDRMVPIVRRSAARIGSLISNLLSAANIQSGRFVIHPVLIELRPLVEEAVDAVADVVQARSQCVRCDLPEGGCPVQADPEYLRLALVNLLTNASKYSPEGAAIEVRASRLEDSIRIEVEDPGPGILLAHQGHLFESFYRGPGDGAQPGLGLGLAIVKEVIEAHGGTVGVQSGPGLGTTFWCLIPTQGGDHGDPPG